MKIRKCGKGFSISFKSTARDQAAAANLLNALGRLAPYRTCARCGGVLPGQPNAPANAYCRCEAKPAEVER